MEKSRDRKEYSRLWHLKNRERRLAARKQNYRANRERILAQTAEYSRKHPEIRKKTQINYRNRHRAECRRRCKEWRAKNLSEQRARERTVRRKAFKNNPDKIRAANRAWAARNKDKIRLRDLRRKALKASAKVNLAGMLEWLALVRSKSTFVCYYCDQRKSIKVLHIDHIVPLSKGGEHSVFNLCTSCSACNCSKQAKSISTWVRIGQQTLEL